MFFYNEMTQHIGLAGVFYRTGRALVRRQARSRSSSCMVSLSPRLCRPRRPGTARPTCVCSRPKARSVRTAQLSHVCGSAHRTVGWFWVGAAPTARQGIGSARPGYELRPASPACQQHSRSCHFAVLPVPSSDQSREGGSSQCQSHGNLGHRSASRQAWRSTGGSGVPAGQYSARGRLASLRR